MIKKIATALSSTINISTKQVTRSFAYFPTHFEKRLDFFNREHELEFLRNRLAGPANENIMVLLGPRNCGKTWLLKEFLRRQGKDVSKAEAQGATKVPYIYIDLRTQAIRNIDGFLQAIGDSIQVFTGKKEDLGRATVRDSVRFMGSIIARDPGAGREVLDLMAKIPDPIQKLDFLFSKYAAMYGGKGGAPFWFMLDEFNIVRRIIEAADKKARNEFMALLEVLVAATKQNKLCKMLLGTTDSSLLVWMKSSLRVDDSWFTPYSMGNSVRITKNVGFLSNSDMNRFLGDIGVEDEKWREMLIKAFGGDTYRCVNALTSVPQDEADIDKAFQKMIESQVMLTKDAVNPRRNDLLSPEAKKLLPKLYYELVHSPTGYLRYDDMEDKYGEKVMENIVLANALYLMAGEHISKDMEKPKDERVLIANSPLHLTVMKKYWSMKEPVKGQVNGMKKETKIKKKMEKKTEKKAE